MVDIKQNTLHAGEYIWGNIDNGNQRQGAIIQVNIIITL